MKGRKMADEKQKPEAGGPESLPEPLKFLYETSPHYRVLHVDGAHGGLMPNARYMHMSLYNETISAPHSSTYQFQPVPKNPGLFEGTSIDVMPEDPLLRTVEVCALMDKHAARALYRWLGDMLATWDAKVEELKARVNSSQDQAERS